MLYALRHANDADKAWLDELRRAVYEPLFRATWGGWDEARHQRHFAATWQQGRIQLIEVNGRRIGMIQLRERDDCVEVGEIQILPEDQNKALGTRLLVEVIDRARQQGRDVILSTGLMNSSASLDIFATSTKGTNCCGICSLSWPAPHVFALKERSSSMAKRRSRFIT